MGVYPTDIDSIVADLNFSGRLDESSVSGSSASFVCGSFVRFYLRIDTTSKCIEDVSYSTNGCGFMVAAAERVASNIRGRKLIELGGSILLELLDGMKLHEPFGDRSHCFVAVYDGIRSALAEHRLRTIEEFQGEGTLVCSCFGVGEDTILSLIHEYRLTSLNQLSSLCKAGQGCGSCQMIIQEMIDAKCLK